jgi:hypothetical protein
MFAPPLKKTNISSFLCPINHEAPSAASLLRQKFLDCHRGSSQANDNKHRRQPPLTANRSVMSDGVLRQSIGTRYHTGEYFD